MLRVCEVGIRLGRRRVLDRVSVACGAGETVVVLGENGAGKSTLLRIVTGVLAPDEGDVLLDGESIVGRRVAGRRRLGYVPEAAEPLPQLTGEELVALVAALKRAPPPGADLVDRLGTASFQAQRIGSMSLGQRRRICLLAALVGAPSLLVLDEPTNGLDPDGVAMLVGLLAEQRARGGAAILATHDMDFVAALDARPVALSAGRVVG